MLHFQAQIHKHIPGDANNQGTAQQKAEKGHQRHLLADGTILYA